MTHLTLTSTALDLIRFFWTEAERKCDQLCQCSDVSLQVIVQCLKDHIVAYLDEQPYGGRCYSTYIIDSSFRFIVFINILYTITSSAPIPMYQTRRIYVFKQLQAVHFWYTYAITGFRLCISVWESTLSSQYIIYGFSVRWSLLRRKVHHHLFVYVVTESLYAGKPIMSHKLNSVLFFHKKRNVLGTLYTPWSISWSFLLNDTTMTVQDIPYSAYFGTLLWS